MQLQQLLFWLALRSLNSQSLDLANVLLVGTHEKHSLQRRPYQPLHVQMVPYLPEHPCSAHEQPLYHKSASCALPD